MNKKAFPVKKIYILTILGIIFLIAQIPDDNTEGKTIRGINQRIGPGKNHTQVIDARAGELRVTWSFYEETNIHFTILSPEGVIAESFDDRSYDQTFQISHDQYEIIWENTGSWDAYVGFSIYYDSILDPEPHSGSSTPSDDVCSSSIVISMIFLGCIVGSLYLLKK